MKNQIILINGGLSFRDENQAIEYYKNKDIDEVKNYKSWKDWLIWSLEDNYDFIYPKLPARDNAEYEIWKIIFEKYLLKQNKEKPIIITHSLGTIFILKYLIENSFKSKIKQLHLVAPIVSNDFQPVNDVEDTGTFTFDISQVNKIQKICKEIHIRHSKDDGMCDYKNAKFLKQQLPKCTLHSFQTRGHFLQPTFPELYDILRK